MDDPRTGLAPPLFDLVSRLARAEDLHSGVEAAAWACEGRFPFYRVSLALPGRRASRCYVAACWARRPEEELSGYDFTMAGHPLEAVVRDGATVVRTEPLEDHVDPLLRRLFRGEGKAEEVGVPLDLPGRRGALIFASRERGAFGAAAQDAARDVARLLSLWLRPWAGPEAPHALKEQYQGLLEGALDGIAVLRGDRTIYANPSFCEIFGVADPARAPFSGFLDPRSVGAFEQGVESLRRRTRVLPRLEVLARSASGRPLHLDLGLQRVLYQGEPAVLLQVHNASERAEREVEARAAHERLDGLMQTLAHDIRGPLVAIVGFSELLPRRLHALGPEQVEKMAGVIARAGGALKDLVEGLLEYSSLDSGEDPIADTALEPLLRAVERELEGLLHRTGGRVEYGPLPPAVRGRPIELQRVFRNLLENGLTYTRPGVEPVVRVACSGREGGHLVLCVEDHGVGIEAERVPKIFELFERGEGGGAGVGLAIVERVVRGHGGRVWVESQPGIGSRFYVTIPSASEPEA